MPKRVLPVALYTGAEAVNTAVTEIRALAGYPGVRARVKASVGAWTDTLVGHFMRPCRD